MPDSSGTDYFVFFLTLSLIFFSFLNRYAGYKKEEDKKNSEDNDRPSFSSVAVVLLIRESVLHSLQ